MKLFLLASLLLLFSSPTELVVVSPHWEGMRYEFENGFARWRKSKGLAPLSISWRDVGGTSDIVRFVQSEFQVTNGRAQRDAIGVDLVFGGGTDPYLNFAKFGLLAPQNIPTEIISHVAKDVRGMPLNNNDNLWFSPTMAAFGIFCNKAVLTRLRLAVPESWSDLMQAGFFGWISSADPRRSGSAHMYYEIILQAYGWERGWQTIYSLAQNIRSFHAGSGQAVLDTVHGEVACSFAIDSQANAHIRNAVPGELVFKVPRKDSLYNGDGIAVLKGAPNPKGAEEFVTYSLSNEAQRLLYFPKGGAAGPERYTLNRMPVIPELYSDPAIADLNPFKEQTGPALLFNGEVSSQRWEALNDLLGIFVIEAKDHGTISSPICQATLPEEKVVDSLLKAGVWQSPVERNKIISEWRNKAANCASSKKVWLLGVPSLLLLSVVVVALLRKLLHPRSV